MASLLRNNNYYVSRIPINWIQKKTSLPPPHWYAENNGLILPITDQDQVQDLISSLQRRFIVKTPLDSRWIAEGLNQNFKPPLPNSYSEVAAKLNLSDSKINKDLFSYKQIIKKITDIFDMTEIPEEWISSSIPNLPSLQEATDHLIFKECDLTLPLIEN